MISYEAYESLTKSGEIGKFSSTAVWKRDGKKTLTGKTTCRETGADCYRMAGQPAAVFGNTLISGRYFTEGEDDVCLIDRKTAEELTGSRDALGTKVELEGKEYRVAGILSGEKQICVLPAGRDTLFDGVTVRKASPGQSSAAAVSVLSAYLGITVQQIVDGQLYYILARLKLALFFLIAAAVPAGVFIILKRKRLAGGLLLAVGLCLCAVTVAATPFGNDYLPTYWSDLDFYGKLYEEKTRQTEALRAYQEFWHESRFLE